MRKKIATIAAGAVIVAVMLLPSILRLVGAFGSLHGSGGFRRDDFVFGLICLAIVTVMGLIIYGIGTMVEGINRPK